MRNESRAYDIIGTIEMLLVATNRI